MSLSTIAVDDIIYIALNFVKSLVGNLKRKWLMPEILTEFNRLFQNSIIKYGNNIFIIYRT